MHTILIIAGTFGAIGIAAAAAVVPIAIHTEIVARPRPCAPLLCGCRLFGGRHIDGRYQIIPAARLERRRTLVLIIATTTRTRSREDQIIYGTRITTCWRLSSRIQSLILLQLIWCRAGQAVIMYVYVLVNVNWCTICVCVCVCVRVCGLSWNT